LAHIRAATGLTPVTDTNCHPFKFGRFLFCHNGVVSRFFDIKIPLLSLLSPAARRNILGTTDTEHAAALFFTHLDPEGPWTRSYSIDEMKTAVRVTIKDLQRLIDAVGGDEGKHSLLNFGITDGEQMLATRYAYPEGVEPPSLYWSTQAGPTLNTKYPDSADGPCDAACMLKKRKDHGKSVIVASEPATYKKDEWNLIPANHMVAVGRTFEVEVAKI